ncbi:hypothetical protein C0J52_05988 [Blattella germanica]|nr:hypothetical protein C0J52_05988 [Blattella germanica]
MKNVMDDFVARFVKAAPTKKTLLAWEKKTFLTGTVRSGKFYPTISINLTLMNPHGSHQTSLNSVITCISISHSFNILASTNLQSHDS